LELPRLRAGKQFRRRNSSFRLENSTATQVKQAIWISKEWPISRQIHDGKKCLCGSLEHPNVMQARRCIGTINNYRDYFKISKQEKKLLRLPTKHRKKLNFRLHMLPNN
jgi:hypothetical protein